MCRENGAFPFSVAVLVFLCLLSIWKEKPNSPVNNFPVFSVQTVFFSCTTAPLRKGSFVLSVVLSLSGERGSGEWALQLCLTCQKPSSEESAIQSLVVWSSPRLRGSPSRPPRPMCLRLMTELTDSEMYLTQGGPAGTFLVFRLFVCFSNWN